MEAGISPQGDKNSDLSSMDNRIKIRDCIQAGKVSEATALVHQLHPELLDDDRYLFFHLQVITDAIINYEMVGHSKYV